MNFKINIFALSLLTIFLTAPGLVLAGEALNGGQIMTLLNGKKAIGTSPSGINFIKQYKKNGTYQLSFKEMDEKVTGSWRINGDLYCQTRKAEGQSEIPEKCYTVERGEKDGTFVMLLNGEQHTTFTIK